MLRNQLFKESSCSTVQCNLNPASSTHRVGPPKLLASILAVVTFANMGAAQQPNTPSGSKSRQVSGFLGDYAGLYPDSKDSNLLVYVKKRGILKQYDKFIVEPVTVQLNAQGEARNLDPSDLKQLAEDCRQALVKELQGSGRYQVVTEPGPGVLRLHAALTDVEPTRNKSNAAVEAGAVAASTAVAPGAALFAPRLSVGGASIEAEMLDSQSNERLVAVVTTKQGRRFFSGVRGMKKWGDAEAAFKQWAKAFHNRLDQLHSTDEQK